MGDDIFDDMFDYLRLNKYKKKYYMIDGR